MGLDRRDPVQNTGLEKSCTVTQLIDIVCSQVGKGNYYGKPKG